MSPEPRQWHRFSPDIEVADEPVGVHQRAKARRNAFKEKTGRDYSDLIADLLEFHKPIGGSFFSKAWGRMQRLDSDIAERVMIKLLGADLSITALPIHDSFIVRRGAERTLQDAMTETFYEVIRTEVGVGREEAVWDGPRRAEGLVYAEQLHQDAIQQLRTHSRYHQREAEWQREWGPIG